MQFSRKLYFPKEIKLESIKFHIASYTTEIACCIKFNRSNQNKAFHLQCFKFILGQ